jgi:hypothetical protein
MKSHIRLLMIIGLLAGIYQADAQTWTQTSAPSNSWRCIASSADGGKCVAGTWPGPIYTSTNSGTTWTQTSAPNDYWSSIASSADGTKLLAAAAYISSGYPGGVYTSTNSGISWISNSLPNEFWNSVATSADGSKLVVVAPLGTAGNGPGAIFTSTNSGSDWVSNAVHGVYVASSADGTKLIVVSSPQVWRSTNSGATWTQDSTAPFIGGFGTPSQAIASSTDGSKLVLALLADSHGNPGPIYISTNSGDTWELTTAPSNQWNFVASSSDGTTLLAVPGAYQTGPIYISTNSGVTWTTNNSPNLFWGAVASAADGGKLVAAAFADASYNGSLIYNAQSIQPPSMNFTPTNGNLKLSWLIPSTNFVMRQSSDLQIWADVTNQPVLNPATLHNEVILSPPGSSVFYLLKTP